MEQKQTPSPAGACFHHHHKQSHHFRLIIHVAVFTHNSHIQNFRKNKATKFLPSANTFQMLLLNRSQDAKWPSVSVLFILCTLPLAVIRPPNWVMSVFISFYLDKRRTSIKWKKKNKLERMLLSAIKKKVAWPNKTVSHDRMTESFWEDGHWSAQNN